MSPTAFLTSASAPSSTPTSQSESDTRMTILIIGFASLGILLLAGSIFLLLRFQRQHSSPTSLSYNPFSSTTNLAHKPRMARGTLITDRSHPAARITPFGSPGGEIPKFSMCPRFPTHVRRPSFENRAHLQLPNAHGPAPTIWRLALCRPPCAFRTCGRCGPRCPTFTAFGSISEGYSVFELKERA
jgi:hypothetical protein